MSSDIQRHVTPHVAPNPAAVGEPADPPGAQAGVAGEIRSTLRRMRWFRRTPVLHIAEDRGEGPTVLLLHGIASSSVTFHHVIPAVDRLSDAGFAVERVAIVGLDVRVVEQVLGRLTGGKAALRGAAVGAWFGVLLGLLFGLFAPGFGWLAIVIISVASGAVWGAWSLARFSGHLV